MFGLTPFNRKNSGIARRGRDIFDFENMFDSFFNDSFFPTNFFGGNQMKVDIRENEKEYIIDAELPGVNKEEIQLELMDDRLTISVKRDEAMNEERDNYIRRERRCASVSRTFAVDNIKQDQVNAKFENGILSVTLPKKEGVANRIKRIDIQ